MTETIVYKEPYNFKVGSCPMLYFVIILSVLTVIAMYFMWVLDKSDKENDRNLDARDASFHELDEEKTDKD